MSPVSNDFPHIDDAFTYRGIDAVFIENERLRLLVLPGKGGDILEFRDKRADVNVLWEAPHNWQPPQSRPVPSVGPTTWLDHYPGGWQVNLPLAGFTDDFGGTPYGVHGESALIPWNHRIVDDGADSVSLRLWTELIRYPFAIERNITLPAGASSVYIEETITNRGNVDLEYIWQQHLAIGPPLLDPAARLDIPAEHGLIEPYGSGHANARLHGGAEFDWPLAPGVSGEPVDLTQIPGPDSQIHDVAFATDLTEGWYALTNPAIDLGFAFEFPVDPFECIWYWQPLHGDEESPYFSRNYNVGIEPTTAHPSTRVPEAQRDNGTIKTLAAGETIAASFRATSYTGFESISSVRDGEIEGTSR